MSRNEDQQPDGRDIARLEWFAAGTGLLLTAGLLAILIWQAWQEPGEQLPAVAAEILAIREANGVHVVAVEARNSSAATAANVIVSGTLLRGGEAVETSEFTLDYVPGNSSRRGGLFFSLDPRGLELEVRALGYADP